MFNYIQNDDRNYDRNFLHEFIYNNVKDISIIHASFHKFEGKLCINFPIPYDNDFKFVGEYVYPHESRCQSHIDMLKNSL